MSGGLSRHSLPGDDELYLSNQYSYDHQEDRECDQKGETAPSSWWLLPGFAIRVEEFLGLFLGAFFIKHE